MEAIYAKGRDNARTPMQWDASPNAGFTTGTPWIRVNPNYMDINVKMAVEDENSILNYYKKLIRLRKEIPVIVYAEYIPILEEDEQIYAYIRTWKDERLLIILNFYGQTTVFNLPESINFKDKELLISNYNVNPQEDIKVIRLRPYETRAYRLK